MDLKSAEECVEQIKGDFETYKDKVEELVVICESHEILNKKLKNENMMWRKLCIRVHDHIANGEFKQLHDIFEGIKL